MYVIKYIFDYSVFIYNGYGKGFLVKYMVCMFWKEGDCCMMIGNYKDG